MILYKITPCLFILHTEILQRALKEGSIKISIIRVLVIGPPGVGKTCVKLLLLDHPPPDKRSSTPIATSAIRARAIQGSRISAQKETCQWNEVSDADLVELISQAMHEFSNKGNLQEKPFVQPVPLPNASTSVALAGRPEEDATPSSGIAKGDHSIPAFQPFLESATTTGKDHLEHNLQAFASFARPAHDQAVHFQGTAAEIEGKVFLSRSGRFRYFQKLSSESFNWVFFIDSGGQPQFMDVLPAFIRGNTVNVFAMKVTDKLSDKPVFEYCQVGRYVSKRSHLEHTNLQMVESIIRSISSTRSAKQSVAGTFTAEPKFLIAATFFDKYSWSKLTSETISGKNRRLLDALGELSDQCIFYDKENQELIFPINTLVKEGREELAAQIRRKIMEAPGVALPVTIPLQWFALELDLTKESNVHSVCALSMSQCTAIARGVHIPNADLKAALNHLASLSLFLYFPAVLPEIIFTKPQVLLSKVSEIISVTFLNRKALPPGVSCTDQLRLQKTGIFSKRMLQAFPDGYILDVFSVEELLILLKHLLIVAPVVVNNEVAYFLPSALSTCTVSALSRMELSDEAEPLWLVCNLKVIPQGMFPTIIIALLQRRVGPLFKLQQNKGGVAAFQFRNAVSFECTTLGGKMMVVDATSRLEVLYSGTREVCSHIHNAMLEAVRAACKTLSYDSQKVTFKAAFACPYRPRHYFTPHHECEAVILPSGSVQLTCSVDPKFSNTTTQLFKSGPDKIAEWFTHFRADDTGRFPDCHYCSFH